MGRKRALRKALRPKPDYSMYPRKPKAEASKTPKPKLRDVSRQRATKEQEDALYRAFLGNNPIVAAILGQCLVEYELDALLRFTMKKMTDAHWDEMTNADGPLGTFSRKIKMASALGIITPVTRSKLDKIRIIRNAFAHAKRLLEFNDPLIVPELMGAEFTKSEASYKDNLPGHETPGTCLSAYQLLCQRAAIAILRRHNRGLGVGRQNRERAAQRRTKNPFTQGLGLFGVGSSPLGLLGVYQPPQTEDPNPGSRPNILAELLRKYALEEPEG